ncbi:hypothetical protein DAPPUDRAFT_234546 [Daphnia pulex]|uniref:Uncharacterized protein n=1 Tax=Daphnia pulex TaxID=6669 RepID=E9FWV5_DAPPU|nr:hypothetical protein DAPPUDRAFT_234546 [Daphnia pulex]|eukprot:EFX87963.1 hypothetical protein DAPPUDRAFT_234546 [Daphnia pulex]
MFTVMAVSTSVRRQLRDRARSFFMESCGHPGTAILVPMLTFVHDGRGTSINVLLHPYLRDARSSSFTVMQRKRREDGHQNVAVNPSAATPLFSPSPPARAALFGLVVYKPRGRRVAKPKICRKASLL